jgi:HlyD family secretion protein
MIVPWSVAALVAIAAIMVVVSRSGPEAPPQAIEPPLLTARGLIDVDGGLVQIASDRDGVIREVLVAEGEKVVKGQPMALVDDQAARIQLSIAEAQVIEKEAAVDQGMVALRQARRERDRVLPLYESGAVSQKSVDLAEDELRQAMATLALRQAELVTSRAQLVSARHEVDVRTVRAPAEGTVIRRFVRPGDGVSTLNVTSLFSFAPNTGVIVRAEVEEDAAGGLTVDQKADIVFESDQARRLATGKVTRVAAAFGPRRATSYETTDRADIRVIEAIVAFDGTPPPTPLGQRVIVRFSPPGASR